MQPDPTLRASEPARGAPRPPHLPRYRVAPRWRGAALPRAGRSPDDLLAAQARAGDGRAFEVLVRRHRAEVHRLALRRSPGRSDADEIVQETFLQAFRALAAYRGEASFRTWLYRIALRVVLMRQRAARRRPTEPLGAGPERPEADALAASGAASLSVPADALLARKELAGALREALDGLGPAYRPVVELRDLEGLSSGAAADALGLSPEAVRQRLRRAHRLLRDRLVRSAAAGRP